MSQTWSEQRGLLESFADHLSDCDAGKDAIRAALARLDAAERIVAPARMLRDGETMAHYNVELGLYEAVAAYDELCREQDNPTPATRRGDAGRVRG